MNENDPLNRPSLDTLGAANDAAPETLRARLTRLADFGPHDFVEKNGLYSVAIGEVDDTLVLIGATGRTCRASLAFPYGYQIGLDPEMSLCMEIGLLGLDAGEPTVVLTLPSMPGAGERRWSLAYFCSNVDNVFIR